MREGMISNFIALRVFLLHNVGILVGGFTDHEKCRGSLLFFQYLQNFRRPIRIGTVVERQCNFARVRAHFFDAPGKRIALVRLVIENVA